VMCSAVYLMVNLQHNDPSLTHLYELSLIAYFSRVLRRFLWQFAEM